LLGLLRLVKMAGDFGPRLGSCVWWKWRKTCALRGSCAWTGLWETCPVRGIFRLVKIWRGLWASLGCCAWWKWCESWGSVGHDIVIGEGRPAHLEAPSLEESLLLNWNFASGEHLHGLERRAQSLRLIWNSPPTKSPLLICKIPHQRRASLSIGTVNSRRNPLACFSSPLSSISEECSVEPLGNG
jgi:hypothetical protein